MTDQGFDNLHKVALLVRDDFFTKEGGDTLQILSYSKYANNLGLTVLTYQELISLGKRLDFELFILTNIDSSCSYLRFYYYLTSIGLGDCLAVLPIHHSLLSSVSLSFGLSALGLLRGHFLRDKLKLLVLVLLRRSSCKPLEALSLLFSNFTRDIRQSLLCSRGLLCIAEAEAGSLSLDMRLSLAGQKILIVRNGCDSCFKSPDLDPCAPRPRTIDLLVVGRIERRKNQLAIAQACVKAGIPVTFVGAVNPNNKSYATSFFRLLSRWPSLLHYVPHVTQSRLSELYSSAKIHLSASMFEVSSLVDIEAYNCGCYVISSSTGYSAEILSPPGFQLARPKDIGRTIATVRSLIDSGKWSDHLQDRVPYSFGWHDSALQFERAVLSLVE